MRSASVIMAFGALVCGLIAAWRWYQSSQITVDPGWHLPGMPGGFTRHGFPRVPEPAEQEQQQMDWIFAAIDAAKETARLNKIAALWTAPAVLFSAASAITSALTLT